MHIFTYIYIVIYIYACIYIFIYFYIFIGLPSRNLEFRKSGILVCRAHLYPF